MYSLGFQNLMNSEKGRLQSLTTRNQKNENFENSRAATEGYFHWLKLLTKAFLSFEFQTTVPLVVYLQTLKSLLSL